MTRKVLAVLFLALGLAAASPSRAEASFITYLCNDVDCLGGGDLTIADGGGTDIDPLAGSIVSTVLVGGLEVLVTTTISKPLIGSATAPAMHQSVTAVNSLGTSGSVWVYSVDTDFDYSGSLIGAYGGALGAGTAQFGIFTSTSSSSLPLNLTSGVQSPVIAGPGPFSGTLLTTNSTNPFALIMKSAITVNGIGASSTDFSVTSVPEPGSMALLGTGLLALGASARRRLRARQKRTDSETK